MELQDEEQDLETSYSGKSFLFDFDKGDFVFRNGKLVPVEGKEALKVWINKVLKTEKFRFEIYEKEEREEEYGVIIEDLIIGHSFSLPFIESEQKREITVALLRHPMIDSLEDFRVEREKSLLRISFEVILADGDSLNQEVIYSRE
ncbi:DUF2634 domain-containing protein [Bacillus infantis]|uniref:DUF2634 domain-containing protein n=1 Tax=Bacillus infantis TaxID=324767 RepID=UPI003CF42251